MFWPMLPNTMCRAHRAEAIVKMLQKELEAAFPAEYATVLPTTGAA